MAATIRLTVSETEAFTPRHPMSRKVRRPLLVAVALKAGLTKSETKGVGCRLLRRKIVDALASSDGQITSNSRRVRVTSGSADPAMMNSDDSSNSLLLDRNGNPLKGTALQARKDKIEREAKASPKAAKAAESKAPSLEARLDKMEEALLLLVKNLAATS